MNNKRIAFGGFQHETNTFAPEQADYEAFLRPGGWPHLCSGTDIYNNVDGMNLPVAGFIQAGIETGFELEPLTWAAATPSAHVTEHAYEQIAGMILQGLGNLQTPDGVYLDLHGAMVTTHREDGEGELLSRIRHIIGPTVPLVASLDLHANVTKQMVEQADVLVAYRTYPHVDMAATGRSAAKLMARLLTGDRPAKAFRQAQFMVPLVWQSDLAEPAASLYADLEDMEKSNSAIWSSSLAMGFPPADIQDAGPTMFAYADSEDAANQAADNIAMGFAAAEPAFSGRIFSPAEAVAYAHSASRRPVVIADSQDNPGAGGNSDTTGMLRELTSKPQEKAVIGVIYDPSAAKTAHQAGVGSEIEIGLGAVSPWKDDTPLVARYRVDALGDGQFMGTGPMFGGARMDLGLMAKLSLNGTDIIVASKKMQAADQSIFRHLGIEPKDMNILVLKSSVHFRADFKDIAGEIIVVAAPGPNPVDHFSLRYENLRKTVRVMPDTGR